MIVRDLIALSFRKIRILASGETSSADEEADALSALQDIVLSHPGMHAGWRDVFATSAATIYARDGERVHAGAFDPTIIKPLTVTDFGWCGRQTQDLAKLQIIGGTGAGLFLFAGEWRQADNLLLDSDNPFGPETNDGLAAQLAVRIADEYGAEPGQTVKNIALRSEKMIRSRLYRTDRARCQDDYQFPQHPFDPFP